MFLIHHPFVVSVTAGQGASSATRNYTAKRLQLPHSLRAMVTTPNVAWELEHSAGYYDMSDNIWEWCKENIPNKSNPFLEKALTAY